MGRPTDDLKDERLSFALPADVARWVRAYAELTGQSLSALIRAALWAYMIEQLRLINKWFDQKLAREKAEHRKAGLPAPSWDRRVEPGTEAELWDARYETIIQGLTLLEKRQKVREQAAAELQLLMAQHRVPAMRQAGAGHDAGEEA